MADSIITRDELESVLTYLQKSQKHLFTELADYQQLAIILADYNFQNCRDYFTKLGKLFPGYDHDAFIIMMDKAQEITVKKNRKKSRLDVFWDECFRVGYVDHKLEILWERISKGALNDVILSRDMAYYLLLKTKFKVLNDLWYQYDNGVYTRVEEHIPYNHVGNLIYDLKSAKSSDSKIKDILKQWRNLAAESVSEMPDIINLKNGIFDLKKRVLLPHDPDRVSFNQLPFDYDPKAPLAHNFFKFLVQATNGDPDLQNEIQKFYGYCLYPSIEYQKAMWLYGLSGTGKSTVAKVLSMLIGDRNWTAMALDRLDSQFELAMILNKRLVWVDEITIDYFSMTTENRLKGLISGAPVPIEFKRQQQFTYMPTAKWVFTANSLPQVHDATDGFYRRLLIIPFNVQVPDHERDENLPAKIALELPGIFNWALAGYDLLKKEGFISLEKSKAIIQSWKEDSEPLRIFIDDNIVITNRDDDEVLVSDVYEKYQSWAFKNGHKVLNSTHFSRRFLSLLASRNILRDRTNQGRIFRRILTKNDAYTLKLK